MRSFRFLESTLSFEMRADGSTSSSFLPRSIPEIPAIHVAYNSVSELCRMTPFSEVAKSEVNINLLAQRTKSAWLDYMFGQWVIPEKFTLPRRMDTFLTSPPPSPLPPGFQEELDFHKSL